VWSHSAHEDGGKASALRFGRNDLHAADLMFWFIGIGAAAFFSRRPLTREEGLVLYTCKARQ